jgi:hypothetical protein
VCVLEKLNIACLELGRLATWPTRGPPARPSCPECELGGGDGVRGEQAEAGISAAIPGPAGKCRAGGSFVTTTRVASMALEG